MPERDPTHDKPATRPAGCARFHRSGGRVLRGPGPDGRSAEPCRGSRNRRNYGLRHCDGARRPRAFLNWFGDREGHGYEYHLLAIALAAAIVVRGSGAISLDRLLYMRSEARRGGKG